MRIGRRWKTWYGRCSPVKSFCSVIEEEARSREPEARMKVALWAVAIACCFGGEVPKAIIYSLAWSPDGLMIALGGDKEVRLVNASTMAAEAMLPDDPSAVRVLGVSRTGKCLAAASGV